MKLILYISLILNILMGLSIYTLFKQKTLVNTDKTEALFKTSSKILQENRWFANYYFRNHVTNKIGVPLYSSMNEINVNIDSIILILDELKHEKPFNEIEYIKTQKTIKQFLTKKTDFLVEVIGNEIKLLRNEQNKIKLGLNKILDFDSIRIKNNDRYQFLIEQDIYKLRFFEYSIMQYITINTESWKNTHSNDHVHKHFPIIVPREIYIPKGKDFKADIYFVRGNIYSGTNAEYDLEIDGKSIPIKNSPYKSNNIFEIAVKPNNSNGKNNFEINYKIKDPYEDDKYSWDNINYEFVVY